MRFERKFQQIVDRESQIERDDREDAERRRLASRTLWQKIADLEIDGDLREVLWELAEGRE